MASNYYTEFKEKKVTAGTPPASRKGGSVASMPQKQGYAKPNLPGKASAGFAKFKKGAKKVCGNSQEYGI